MVQGQKKREREEDPTAQAIDQMIAPQTSSQLTDVSLLALTPGPLADFPHNPSGSGGSTLPAHEVKGNIGLVVEFDEPTNQPASKHLQFLCVLALFVKNADQSNGHHP